MMFSFHPAISDFAALLDATYMLHSWLVGPPAYYGLILDSSWEYGRGIFSQEARLRANGNMQPDQNECGSVTEYPMTGIRKFGIGSSATVSNRSGDRWISRF